MIIVNKIKKFIVVMSVLALLFTMTGCGNEEEVVDSQGDEPVDVLLITDYGTVNDGSFNEAAWSAISMYSNDTGDIVDYYQPASTDKESFLNEVKRGVKNGAKVIVCPGYLLEEAVYDAQFKYPEVKFILIDGEPHNEDYSEKKCADNTVAIVFAEEQAGFLAGYAAVRDGYTCLGFMGGIAEDPVIRYGYGFVQGADYAAIEMGVSVRVRYTYMNTFNDDPIVEKTAQTWFDDDTEIIFACGGALGKGVMRAAEGHEGKVIGVDVDQSTLSETVVTSAMKSVNGAVFAELMNYKNGKFSSGFTKRYSAAESGVKLPMDTSRFDKFLPSDYELVYSRFVDGMIEPYKETNIGTTQELTLVNTNVTYILMDEVVNN